MKFMSRIAAAAALAIAIVSGGDAAFALTPQQDALVRQAESTMNGIRTMKARFLQVTSNGDLAEGTVFLSRPGRIRIEYDPPSPLLVVANGSYFTFVDTKLQQFSYMDLDSTPAGLLLRKTVRLSDSDVHVQKVVEKAGIAEITVISKSDPTSGSLTLVFTERPFELRQWRVVDAQGIVTDVTLQNPETGVTLKDGLFETPRPQDNNIR